MAYAIKNLTYCSISNQMAGNSLRWLIFQLYEEKNIKTDIKSGAAEIVVILNYNNEDE